MLTSILAYFTGQINGSTTTGVILFDKSYDILYNSITSG